MSQSLGLLEVKGLVATITAVDVMSKSANINVLDIERAKGFAWFTVKITGQIGAVQSAIDAGSAELKLLDLFVSAKVIPRVSSVVLETFKDTNNKDNLKTINKSVKRVSSSETVSDMLDDKEVALPSITETNGNEGLNLTNLADSPQETNEASISEDVKQKNDLLDTEPTVVEIKPKRTKSARKSKK